MTSNTEKVHIPMTEYKKLTKFYEKSQQRFRNSNFFRKRIYLAVGFFLLLTVVTPFLTPSDTKLDIFSLIMSISFIALIVLVDQLVLGFYYYDKDIK